MLLGNHIFFENKKKNDIMNNDWRSTTFPHILFFTFASTINKTISFYKALEERTSETFKPNKNI
jgi:hypothetical protein